MNIGLFRQLQISYVGGVLLTWVVQFTALTQSLVVDRQGHGLHVHQLVVGDSGLVEEDRDGEGDLLYRLLHTGVERQWCGLGRPVFALTERMVWSLCLMRSCSCLSIVTFVCSSSSWCVVASAIQVL